MKVEATNLEGCFLIHPTVYKDDRGLFYEAFNAERFKTETGLHVGFVQDNHSLSDYGVIRGLHFQKGKHAQAKLVQVLSGKVLDVVVDLRKSSPTFGQHFSVVLSAENRTQLYVPRGFAHGFSVLEDQTIFSYKCDNYYHKASESGIYYNDPTLNIDWKLPKGTALLSEKDQLLPLLDSINTDLV